MKLQKRIEYLSRAIMSAKSSTMRTSSATEGEFLHELEEKMEVRALFLTEGVLCLNDRLHPECVSPRVPEWTELSHILPCLVVSALCVLQLLMLNALILHSFESGGCA